MINPWVAKHISLPYVSTHLGVNTHAIAIAFVIVRYINRHVTQCPNLQFMKQLFHNGGEVVKHCSILANSQQNSNTDVHNTLWSSAVDLLVYQLAYTTVKPVG